MSAAIDKEEEATKEEIDEAKNLCKGDDEKQVGAVYVRMMKTWDGQMKSAIQNWVNFFENCSILFDKIQVYSGHAKDPESRQGAHLKCLAVAQRHLFMVNNDSEATFATDEEPILVAEQLPMKLAKAIEQCLILSREEPGRNINIPYQRQIPMEHAQIMKLSARMLIGAFKKPIRIGLGKGKIKKGNY